MPPTSDGAMGTFEPRMSSKAMFDGREEGNQNWCSRRALHVTIFLPTLLNFLARMRLKKSLAEIPLMMFCPLRMKLLSLRQFVSSKGMVYVSCFYLMLAHESAWKGKIN